MVAPGTIPLATTDAATQGEGHGPVQEVWEGDCVIMVEDGVAPGHEKIGLVSRVPNDESSSDDEYSNEWDDGHSTHSEDSSIPEGHAAVCWLEFGTGAAPQGEPVEFGRLRVVDRQIRQGDAVFHVSDPVGQSGLVVEVDMTADLRLDDGSDVRGARPGQCLRCPSPFLVDQYVVGSGWVGRVEEVHEILIVQMEDGSIAELQEVGALFMVALLPVDPQDGVFYDEDTCPFYPGQELFLRDSQVAEDPNWRWLVGPLSSNPGLLCTVLRVAPTTIVVDWISMIPRFAAAGAEGDAAAYGEPPEASQDACDLVGLDEAACHDCSWRIGDHGVWCAPGGEAAAAAAGGGGGEAGAAGGARAADASGAANGIENGLPQPVMTGVSHSEATVQALMSTTLARSTLRRIMRMIGSGLDARQMATAARGGPEVRLPRTARVLRTRTLLDVRWQDGTESKGVPAIEFLPARHLDDHDFFPGEYVEEADSPLLAGDFGMAGAADGDGPGPARRAGYVVSMRVAARTARVAWFKAERGPDGSLEVAGEEDVSVYTLHPHADFRFHSGDLVLRIEPPAPLPAAEAGTAAAGAANGGGRAMEVDAPGAAEQLRDVGEFAVPGPVRPAAWAEGEALSAAPWRHSAALDTPQHREALRGVGVVDVLQGGRVGVLWADGTRSCVGPTELVIVHSEDDPGGPEGDSEFSGEEGDHGAGSSWYTASDDEERAAMAPGTAPAEFEAAVGDYLMRQQLQQHEDEVSSGAPALAQLRELSMEAGSPDMMSPRDGAPDDDDDEGSSDSEHGSEMDAVPPESSRPARRISPTSVGVPVRGSRSAEEDGVPQQQPAEPAAMPSSDAVLRVLWQAMASGAQVSPDAPEAAANGAAHVAGTANGATETPLSGFPHFDVIEDAPAGHHFATQDLEGPLSRAFQRAVLREWDSLRGNLPDTIWVRAYESRMDLLRACIAGPAGTPYHGTLYFFDIGLPADYPASPPQLHYHSHGLRVNPNLYEDGRVCLSLLNTWQGRGTEVWDAARSSLLQLLVSVQGLVLVAEPYYNEAGFERQQGSAEGGRNARLYNESAFLLALRIALATMRAPPPPFGPLLQAYYRENREALLRACAVYMAGRTRIGGQLPADAAEPTDVTEPSGSGGRAEDRPSTAAGPGEETSEGFRMMLRQILPRLAAVLQAL